MLFDEKALQQTFKDMKIDQNRIGIVSMNIKVLFSIFRKF